MDCDYLIIGSGFGGSVSALRLAEKGYRVIVLEKGRRLTALDFPKTNWNIRRWMWLPALGCRGLFKMTWFRHVTVVSGVGVGGGSLTYANTLPIPERSFFTSPSWAHLADWHSELSPHYLTARRMLGAVENPMLTVTDDVMKDVAKDIGREAHFKPTTVAVYFGKPGVTVPDPFFNGEGPERTGCIGCGGCMLGCRYGAKNTLDKNYLYLAEKHGVQVQPDTEVVGVTPVEGGYEVTAYQGAKLWGRKTVTLRAPHVIFSGGVLGSVSLLLQLRAESLPKLSARVGSFIRTNSEALIGVLCKNRHRDLSKGIAISSIIQTDEHSSLEPVRYPAGSGFFRLLTLPHVTGNSMLMRMFLLCMTIVKHPLRLLQALMARDFARQSVILLYMRTLEGHLAMRLRRGLFGKTVSTAVAEGPSPTANIPEAADLAERVADKLGGVPMTLLTETLFNIPTTAHILGGCVMGETPETGVINHKHEVFGYPGLYVIDGSAISANPGVNPSLSICALAERAITFIPQK